MHQNKAASSQYPQVLKSDRELIIRELRKQNIKLNDFSKVNEFYFLFYLSACFFPLIFLLYGRSHGSLHFILFSLPIPFIQHAMFNIVHEASHQLLSKSKLWNDILGNFFALPVGMTVWAYRAPHRAHHDYVSTNKDPSAVSYRPDAPINEVRKYILSALSGGYLLNMIRPQEKNRKYGGPHKDASKILKNRIALLLVYHFTTLFFAIYFGLFAEWLFWEISAFTLLPFLESIRTNVEHRKLEGDSANFHTRGHHINPLISSLSAPFFQYHWEHHLFEKIPHYQLAKLHNLLVNAGVKEALPVKGGFYRTVIRIFSEKK